MHKRGRYHLRSAEQIKGFFHGLDLVPPGVVSSSQWRPETSDIGGDPDAVDAIGGIGRKP
jgi:S-adenosyl methyltransferase